MPMRQSLITFAISMNLVRADAPTDGRAELKFQGYMDSRAQRPAIP